MWLSYDDVDGNHKVHDVLSVACENKTYVSKEGNVRVVPKSATDVMVYSESTLQTKKAQV